MNLKVLSLILGFKREVIYTENKEKDYILDKLEYYLSKLEEVTNLDLKRIYDNNIKNDLSYIFINWLVGSSIPFILNCGEKISNNKYPLLERIKTEGFLNTFNSSLQFFEKDFLKKIISGDISIHKMNLISMNIINSISLYSPYIYYSKLFEFEKRKNNTEKNELILKIINNLYISGHRGLYNAISSSIIFLNNYFFLSHKKIETNLSRMIPERQFAIFSHLINDQYPFPDKDIFSYMDEPVIPLVGKVSLVDSFFLNSLENKELKFEDIIEKRVKFFTNNLPEIKEYIEGTYKSIMLNNPVIEPNHIRKMFLNILKLIEKNKMNFYKYPYFISLLKDVVQAKMFDFIPLEFCELNNNEYKFLNEILEYLFLYSNTKDYHISINNNEIMVKNQLEKFFRKYNISGKYRPFIFEKVIINKPYQRSNFFRDVFNLDYKISLHKSIKLSNNVEFEKLYNIYGLSTEDYKKSLNEFIRFFRPFNQEEIFLFFSGCYDSDCDFYRFFRFIYLIYKTTYSRFNKKMYTEKKSFITILKEKYFTFPFSGFDKFLTFFIDKLEEQRSKENNNLKKIYLSVLQKKIKKGIREEDFFNIVSSFYEESVFLFENIFDDLNITFQRNSLVQFINSLKYIRDNPVLKEKNSKIDFILEKFNEITDITNIDKFDFSVEKGEKLKKLLETKEIENFIKNLICKGKKSKISNTKEKLLKELKLCISIKSEINKTKKIYSSSPFCIYKSLIKDLRKLEFNSEFNKQSINYYKYYNSLDEINDSFDNKDIEISEYISSISTVYNGLKNQIKPIINESNLDYSIGDRISKKIDVLLPCFEHLISELKDIRRILETNISPNNIKPLDVDVFIQSESLYKLFFSKECEKKEENNERPHYEKRTFSYIIRDWFRKRYFYITDDKVNLWIPLSFIIVFFLGIGLKDIINFNVHYYTDLHFFLSIVGIIILNTIRISTTTKNFLISIKRGFMSFLINLSWAISLIYLINYLSVSLISIVILSVLILIQSTKILYLSEWNYLYKNDNKNFYINNSFYSAKSMVIATVLLLTLIITYILLLPLGNLITELCNILKNSIRIIFIYSLLQFFPFLFPEGTTKQQKIFDDTISFLKKSVSKNFRIFVSTIMKFICWVMKLINKLKRLVVNLFYSMPLSFFKWLIKKIFG